MSKDIGRLFMDETSIYNLGPSDQSMGKEMPPLEKGYAGRGSTIKLPRPKNDDVGKIDLTEAIEKRRSIRKYLEKPLSLEELSYLLWATQGVQKNLEKATLRTSPSAGARHALENYLLVNKVEGLEKGIYHYIALEHVLQEWEIDSALAEKITAACFGQGMVQNSAVTFIWSAVPYRMNWRYGERGYRYLHLDVGHVGQNLYLAAEATGSGVCAIGAYDDAEINKLLGLNEDEEFVIYLASVGKKEQ